MTRLADLDERYDLFLVDQFGVLHDGERAYPGAPEALRRLRAENRRVVIFSNSGKRIPPNERRLVSFGFDPESWDLFLTSGEVAHGLLAAGDLFPERPAKCLAFTRDQDSSVIDGLDIEAVTDGARADFVLIAGSEAPKVGIEEYRRRLEPALARGAPALCANPDMTMLTPWGPAFAPGRIARLYESMGGAVTWIGKPYPEIYRAALAHFPEARRAIGIGDSIEHDVAGAKRAGISAALVRTGILADMVEDALEAECEAQGARPDHILERFA